MWVTHGPRQMLMCVRLCTPTPLLRLLLLWKAPCRVTTPLLFVLHVLNFREWLVLMFNRPSQTR